MITKKLKKKLVNYYCKSCDYNTSDKNDFKRHKLTRKHLKMENGNKKTGSVENICENCGKQYKHRSGLSRHKKKCIKIDDENVENWKKLEKKRVTKKTEKKKSTKKIKKIDEKIEETDKYQINENYWKEQAEKSLKEKLELQAKIYETELHHKNEIIKMQDEILNIVKKSTTTNNTTNNFNNCNNKSLTLNVFLNKNCKNAMNLTDFVDQIKVQLEDVLYQKDHGCAEGLTNILTKQLKDMNPMERPIHCSDEKRLQFYIKEDDKWSKNDTEEEMEKSLRKIQVKQVQVMKEWEDEHPNFDNDDELLEERNKLMAEILHGCEDSTEMKKNVKEIQKNVAKLLSIQEAMDSVKK